MGEGEVWFVSSQNEVWGPYPWDSLREFVTSGRVKRHSLVCNDRKSWIPAEKVPGLFDGIAPERPPRRVGLFAKRLVLGALVLASLGLLGWGGWWLWGQVASGIEVPSTSPDLATPESAARVCCQRILEQARSVSNDALAVGEWELACDERELAWQADPADKRKELDRRRKKLDFTKAHVAELTSDKVEIVEVSDVPNTGKKVVVRLYGKQATEKKGSQDEYELTDHDEKMTLLLTQADGKWKVKQK